MSISSSQQRRACRDPEAHDAHMRLNGECPWCGALDVSQIEWDASQPCIAGTIGCSSRHESLDDECATW
jgi:hypothetical protein